jgi:predicted ATPase with chaperone activity
VRNVIVHESDVERAFAHLVIESKTLEEVGTALNSGASIFLHGSAGVRKTAIAETISLVLSEDDVWIPCAVAVDGNIIVVFDAMIHKQTATGKETEDKRWVRCHRPPVLVGGELTAEMLDLQLNPGTGFYVGPVRKKANNGVLILDDFGRQRTRPEELLNRWVAPLDRGIDFLTLAGGKKIVIPFEMLVVFATNMNPAELVDAAFLRRIQTTINIAVASDEQFCEVFRRLANERGLEVDSVLLHELIAEIRGRHHQELRGCQPRDLINQIFRAARFKSKQPCLDRASLIKAAERYFLSDS